MGEGHDVALDLAARGAIFVATVADTERIDRPWANNFQIRPPVSFKAVTGTGTDVGHEGLIAGCLRYHGA